MKLSVWHVSPLLILILAACNMAQPPEASIAAQAIRLAPGVAFLPPVGEEVDTSAFYPGADLRFEVYRLNGDTVGERLEPTLTMADGSVRVEDGYYLGLWRMQDTLNAAPDATLVQVQAWATDLEPGSDLADGTSCIATDSVKGCLVGTFDAMLRRDKKAKSVAGTIDLTKTQTLPIKVFLPGAANRPESLSEVNRLVAPNSPFEDVGPNCTVDEFTMPGQGLNALGSGLNALGSGLNALGSVGGLFLLDPGSTVGAPGIRLFAPGEAGVLAKDLAGNPALTENAAILVVDDFGFDQSTWSPIYELGSGLTEPSPSMTVQDLETLVQGSTFSHGALVLDQIVRMAAAAGFDTLLTPDAWPDFRIYERSVDNAEVSKQYLIVAAVDTHGFDTDVIAQRIQNALNGLRYYSSQIDGFDIRDVAINMSFAIVPCSVLEDFDASELASFEEYVAALGVDNKVAADFYDELTALLVTPLEVDTEPLLLQTDRCSNEEIVINIVTQDMYVPDPYEPSWPGDVSWQALVEWPEEFQEAGIPVWECSLTDASVVYVASSGNFALDYPMYPAAWPLVVGTSSQNADSSGSGFESTKSSFSNSGEVMAPGALYELGRSSLNDPQRVIAYAGTSFAAPVVSLFTALDLMHDASKCGLSDTSRLTWFQDDGNTDLVDAVEPNCVP